jgi:regulation of enolase protein 1 (concanavalin A-like superfamily)
MDSIKLKSLPRELIWKNKPIDWVLGHNDDLTIIAGERTDWFCDPIKRVLINNAPSALFVPPDESFLLSAKVKVNFISDFDAGVMQVFESNKKWAKLCFEYSPQHKPMIVSVVTKGISDDCNSVVINGDESYLRIAVTPSAIAFHYSLDSSYWYFVRYFSMGTLKNLHVGFLSQSPIGNQTAAVFSDIRYQAGMLKDYRDGT